MPRGSNPMAIEAEIDAAGPISMAEAFRRVP